MRFASWRPAIVQTMNVPSQDVISRDNISVNVLSPHLPLWSEGGAYFRQANDGENYSGWRMSGEIIGDAAVVIEATTLLARGQFKRANISRIRSNTPV